MKERPSSVPRVHRDGKHVQATLASHPLTKLATPSHHNVFDVNCAEDPPTYPDVLSRGSINLPTTHLKPCLLKGDSDRKVPCVGESIESPRNVPVRATMAGAMLRACNQCHPIIPRRLIANR